MDAEMLRLRAHLDQTRSEVRAIIVKRDPDELASIIKTCARGTLGDFDDRLQLMVGMLAVVAIIDLMEGEP